MANLFRANKKGNGGIQVDSLTITQMPTKTYYIQNETLDLTGLKVSATAGALSGDVSNLITTQPASGATMSTLGTNTITVSYGGATTTFAVTVAVVPETLNECSWDLIQRLALAGTLGDYYNEGDTKTITLATDEILTLQLASINDGTGSAGTYYPNHTADFVSVELMDSSHRMNSTNTNVGGWNDSEMRTYLNNTIYPTLPSDLKNVIVEKTHMRTAGGESTNLVSASDKLWLPTYWEVYGVYNSAILEDSDHNKHYSIFPDNASRKKYRKAAPTTTREWWLSSPPFNYSPGFPVVTGTGAFNYAGATDSSRCVTLCFRIG